MINFTSVNRNRSTIPRSFDVLFKIQGDWRSAETVRGTVRGLIAEPSVIWAQRTTVDSLTDYAISRSHIRTVTFPLKSAGIRLTDWTHSAVTSLSQRYDVKRQNSRYSFSYSRVRDFFYLFIWHSTSMQIDCVFSLQLLLSSHWNDESPHNTWREFFDIMLPELYCLRSVSQSFSQMFSVVAFGIILVHTDWFSWMHWPNVWPFTSSNQNWFKRYAICPDSRISFVFPANLFRSNILASIVHKHVRCSIVEC